MKKFLSLIGTAVLALTFTASIADMDPDNLAGISVDC